MAISLASQCLYFKEVSLIISDRDSSGKNKKNRGGTSFKGIFEMLPRYALGYDGETIR
jgi:hypothetical protein